MPDYTAESTRCTALTHKGKFCDYESLPDAPFPMCIKHAAMMLRYLNSYAPEGLEDRIILAARAFGQRPEVPRRSATAGRGVVYYLRVGANVKIGFTTDLRQRMHGYPPDSELLACEPGDYALEQRRHRQFIHHLRVGKEWFEPSDEVMAHVAEVRKTHALGQFLPPRRSPTPPRDKYGRELGAA